MCPGLAVDPESVLFGVSVVMQRVRDQIATLAALDWHVRIEGPSGSGKSVAARVLHGLSSRAQAPFVVCSVAMLPDNAELAELVGHRRGAFTGAVEDRAGKVEDAHTGTLFLEELGTASPRTQEILLQLVDERTFSRMGENRVRSVDVRFVSATNERLETLVGQGRFRADLYYRLGLLLIQMPALTEHREDIPDLVDRLLAQQCRQAGVALPPLSHEALERLVAFSWPGNVRQLSSALQYFVAFGRLPDSIARSRGEADWRDQMTDVLGRCGGNKAATARVLGVSRTTLHRELTRRRGLHTG